MLGLGDYAQEVRVLDAPCWGCLAASIRRSPPVWPPPRWDRATCSAWRCPAATQRPQSCTDAADLARNLGIDFQVIPIDAVFQTYLDVLVPAFRGRPPDLTEENLQARIRGAVLMALSNKFGHLLLSTGNKSELAVGFCTLYGDMSGGLAILNDVPKTLRLSPGPLHQSRAADHSGIDAHEGADGGVASRSARCRLAAAVRRAGRHHRRPTWRGSSTWRRSARSASTARVVVDVDPPHRPERIQAAAGGARASRFPRKRSASAAGIRSRRTTTRSE